MTQRETVLSCALLQTAPGVFLFDPARQEGLSGDNSGDGIGLCLLEFSKFSCSKALLPYREMGLQLLNAVSLATTALFFQFSD